MQDLHDTFGDFGGVMFNFGFDSSGHHFLQIQPIRKDYNGMILRQNLY